MTVPAPLRPTAALQAAPRFFGYGSLVNRATHAYPDARPGHVDGWRRTWRHTGLRPEAFLSAVAAPGHRLHGVTAAVPDADWAALDLRETGYRRSSLPEGPQIYHMVPGDHPPPAGPCPIQLSYLDVVVQGYLIVYGEAGVADFFETTDGWDAPIHDDRAAPDYPRAQVLDPTQRALVDRWLARVA